MPKVAIDPSEFDLTPEAVPRLCGLIAAAVCADELNPETAMAALSACDVALRAHVAGRVARIDAATESDPKQHRMPPLHHAHEPTRQEIEGQLIRSQNLHSPLPDTGMLPAPKAQLINRNDTYEGRELSPKELKTKYGAYDHLQQFRDTPE